MVNPFEGARPRVCEVFIFSCFRAIVDLRNSVVTQMCNVKYFISNSSLLCVCKHYSHHHLPLQVMFMLCSSSIFNTTLC